MNTHEIKMLLEKAQKAGIQKYVVGAFIVQDGQFLILKRASHEDFLPNLDEIPSGGVEVEESLLDALKREVAEETGLGLHSIDAFINYFDYLSSSGKPTRQFNFSVTVQPNQTIQLNPDEHRAYQWAHPSMFNTLNTTPETHQCLCNAAENFQLNSRHPHFKN